MNKIYKTSLTLCCIFIMCSGMGQPNNTPDCHPSGPFISTAPVPYTGQSYQTNTWDWTQEHLPSSNNSDYVTQSNLNNNPLPAGLENPFYQMTTPYLGRIAGGTNSDFYPADGWELIKRDFGTLSNGLQNSTCAPAPYFILYNRYSGKLRVISSAYGLGLHQIINVDLHFIDPAGPFSTYWNISSYSTSGLFAHYGNVSIPLDQNSAPISTVYSTPAVFPSSDYSFFYGDFQMAYDPCTCLFQSGLQIDFMIVDTLNVNIGGNILASSIPITDNTAQNVIDPNHNWLASVSQSGGNVNGGMLIYNSLDSAVADYLAFQANYEDQITSSRSLNAYIGSLSALTSGIGQIANGYSVADINISKNSEAAPFAYNGHVGGDLQAIGSTVNFIGAQVLQNTNYDGPPTEPMVIYGQAQLAGKITESTTIGAGSIEIGTPGCAGSPSLPEKTSSSPDNVPPYPEYNEILGVFALLKTPNVIRFDWIDTVIIGTVMQYEHRHAYRLESPSEIQYALNPIGNANMSKTIIQAAWEDYWVDSISGYSLDDNILYVAPGSINLNPMFFSAGYIDYISPFLDMDHFQNLYVSPPFVFDPADLDPIVDGATSVDLPDISYDLLFLKINIAFVSNDLGRSGYANKSIFTIRYAIPADHITEEVVQGIKSPGLFPPNSSLPGFVNIPSPLTNDTISTATSITSDITGFCNIYINAPITTASSTPINILASNSIEIGDGGSVGPNINIKIIPYDGVPAGSSIPPLSNDDVSTFCSTSNYKANQSMSKTNYAAANTTTNSVNLQSNFNINLYPNPTSGECTVRFTESAGANVSITVADITGREVATIDNSWHNQGTSFVPFNTQSYAPGVYLVKFSDGTNASTQRLTIAQK